MSEKLTKEELWGDEAKVAERIVVWFDLLLKLRRLADINPASTIEQLRRCDPDMMEGAQICLHKMLMDRFTLEDRQIDKSLKAAIAAASKPCPYTQDEYDAARAKVGEKQEALAAELGVDPKTLRKHRRPAK